MISPPSYWESVAAQPAESASVETQRPPLVSVIVTNHNLAQHLPETLASVAASTHSNLEIVIVDDASTDPLDQRVIQRLQDEAAAADHGLRVIRNRVNRGLSSSRNLGIAAARGEYILPLDADDAISADFVALAVAALERHPEFDGVVPQTAYFLSDEELSARRFCDYAMFLGDVPSLGLIANRLASATSLLRRSVFDQVRYDERLTAYEDWGFYLQLVHRGARLLVTNGVYFYYRRRTNSMVSSVDRGRHSALHAQIVDSLPRPLSPAARLSSLLTLVPAAMATGQSESLDYPLRHKLVDRIDENLKRLPLLQPLIRRAALEMARRVQRREPKDA